MADPTPNEPTVSVVVDNEPVHTLAHVDQYLLIAQESGASDIHLGVNSQPIWRRNGLLEAIWLQADKLTAADTESLAMGFLDDHQKQLLAERGDVDFAYSNPNGRFRASVVRQRIGIDLVFRIISTNLRSMDDLGLPEAARAYIEDWSHNYKISSDFDIRGFGNDRLPPETETHLYRIMQESLNNIIKHAQATNVNVLLEWNKAGVNLIVEDNGKGFTPSDNRNRKAGDGLGLIGMRERALLIGGDVQIESSPGMGTTLFIRVPQNNHRQK